MIWTLRHGTLDFSRGPLVMGVLNVTPDSFSDGGDAFEPDRAERRARDLLDQGADIIDVGPESTRPGSAPVTAEEQIARITPVLRRIRAAAGRIPISIDTRIASVAAAAIEMGADIINDVSSLRDDPEMAKLAGSTDTPVILMHMRGSPGDMQSDPAAIRYGNVVEDIVDFLRGRIDDAVRHGVQPDRIAVDPGIGFGKRPEHNLAILNRLSEFSELASPVVVGASRKSFIGVVADEPDPRARSAGSLACAAIAAYHGAHVIRTHEVAATRQAVRLAAAIRGAR